MAEAGTVVIEFERDLVPPVADHVVALINEVLEPFKARVISEDLPIAVATPRQYKRPELLGG